MDFPVVANATLVIPFAFPIKLVAVRTPTMFILPAPEIVFPDGIVTPCEKITAEYKIAIDPAPRNKCDFIGTSDEYFTQLSKFEEPLRDYVRSVILNIY